MAARGCALLEMACSENPPKTRAQKPNNGGVWSLQKHLDRGVAGAKPDIPGPLSLEVALTRC
jgi:hypothetical protein